MGLLGNELGLGHSPGIEKGACHERAVGIDRQKSVTPLLPSCKSGEPIQSRGSLTLL